jgi:hypothetical protein
MTNKWRSSVYNKKCIFSSLNVNKRFEKHKQSQLETETETDWKTSRQDNCEMNCLFFRDEKKTF